MAIHLTTGESLDPTFGQQWTATEDGRRFITLSSEAWFAANVAGGADPEAARAMRGSLRGGLPRGGVKLEHVLARPARRDILEAMNAQTPVQIAWVTHDLDATEAALTGLLGAKKWVRMPGCPLRPRHLHLPWRSPPTSSPTSR